MDKNKAIEYVLAQLQPHDSVIQRYVLRGDKNILKKIFISHSVKDIEIGNKFLDFIESLGFDKSNVFYSSKFHNGVELGKTFPDVVKNNFKESDLIVFLLTSNFYESSYCLNEMGAAWISEEKEIVPILLGDLSFSDMKGFIDSRTKTFSPKFSEPEELFSFFSKRAPRIYDDNIAKEKYNEFLTTSISNVKLLDADISIKSQEILFEIKNSKEKYAIYSNVFNIVQIQCNHRDLCANATAEEKIEYKDAMEQLIALGYVESKNKRNMFKFIYITKKGLDFINRQENDLQKI